jgi:HemX protein
VGIAAFATAAAAGTMYLVQRRELRSHRFTTIFRFFPPLATLDRVNHLAAIGGWLGLTLGVVLATTYSVAYHEINVPQIVWGSGAWIAVTLLAVGRIARGWQAQRAAKFASVAFVAVLVLYVAFRVTSPSVGQFL